MKKTILLLFIAVGLFAINISFVNACKCVKPASPQKALEQSSAVFVGKVIDINEFSDASLSNGDNLKIKFEISVTWKGPDSDILILTTTKNTASCGYPFKKNKFYLVYASGEGKNLSTNICSRTKLITEAGEDIDKLGQGTLINFKDINEGEVDDSKDNSFIDINNDLGVDNLREDSYSNNISKKYNITQIVLVSIGAIILITIIALLIKKYRK